MGLMGTSWSLMISAKMNPSRAATVRICNQDSAEPRFPSKYTWCRHHRLLNFSRATEQQAWTETSLKDLLIAYKWTVVRCSVTQTTAAWNPAPVTHVPASAPTSVRKGCPSSTGASWKRPRPCLLWISLLLTQRWAKKITQTMARTFLKQTSTKPSPKPTTRSTRGRLHGADKPSGPGTATTRGRTRKEESRTGGATIPGGPWKRACAAATRRSTEAVCSAWRRLRPCCLDWCCLWPSAWPSLSSFPPQEGSDIFLRRQQFIKMLDLWPLFNKTHWHITCYMSLCRTSTSTSLPCRWCAWFFRWAPSCWSAYPGSLPWGAVEGCWRSLCGEPSTLLP